MSISSLLMIGIGLALLYSILAILVSATQEMISGWLSIRASSLDARLRSMLADHASEPNLAWGFLKRLCVIICRSAPPPLSASTLYKDLQATGLLTSAAAGANPSYISSSGFTQALAEALRAKGALSAVEPQLIHQIEAGINLLPSGRSTTALKSMLAQANGEIEAFKASLGAWFDEGMDRLNGIYTRWSRTFSLVVGIGIALFLNIDSITVAKSLLTLDARQQEALIAVANATVAKNPQTSAEVMNLLPSLDMPIGRGDCGTATTPGCEDYAWLVPNGVRSLIGWVITAIAISFGSHFWFDLLGKLLDLRASGPKPADSKDS